MFATLIFSVALHVRAAAPADEPLARVLAKRLTTKLVDDPFIFEELEFSALARFGRSIDDVPTVKFVRREFLEETDGWKVRARQQFRYFMARAGLPTGMTEREADAWRQYPDSALFTPLHAVFQLPVGVLKRHHVYLVIDALRVFIGPKAHVLKYSGWSRRLREALERHLGQPLQSFALDADGGLVFADPPCAAPLIGPIPAMESAGRNSDHNKAKSREGFRPEPRIIGGAPRT